MSKIKQFEKLKENLEEQYGVQIDRFLEDYKNYKTLREMAESYNVTIWAIRAVAQALNLRLAKKYRHHDLTLLYTRQQDGADSKLIEEINHLNETLEQLTADYENKVVALGRTKARLKAYKSLEKHLISQETTKEIVDTIVSQEVEPIKPLEQLKMTFGHTIQFLVLSDVHAEALVTKDDVGEANEYNWNIMEQRVRKLFQKVYTNPTNSKELHIYFLGDMINGLIHDAMSNSSEHFVKAVAMLAELLADLTQQQASWYKQVKLFCVSGNHSRIQQNISYNNKGFDYEYLLYTLIKQKVSLQDNIEVSISTTGIICYKPYDTYGIALHHGDMFRNTTGSVERALKIREVSRQATKIEPSIIIQGHTHITGMCQLPFGWELVNGSVVGATPYSHHNGFPPVKPCQLIGLIDKTGLLEVNPVVL